MKGSPYLFSELQWESTEVACWDNLSILAWGDIVFIGGLEIALLIKSGTPRFISRLAVSIQFYIIIIILLKDDISLWFLELLKFFALLVLLLRINLLFLLSCSLGEQLFILLTCSR